MLKRSLGLVLVLGALLAPALAGASVITISGIDQLTQYTASSGDLTFSDTGGAPGQVTGDDTGLLSLGQTGSQVFLDLTLSDFGFNGTAAYDPVNDRNIQGNFIGKSVGSSDLPAFTVRDSTGTQTLLIFNALVNEDDFDALGGPRGGIKTSQSAVANPSAGDPDGSISIGNLNVATDPACVGAIGGLCGNELVLVGGSLAGDFGGIGSIAHLNLRLVSPNPNVTSARGYYGADFVAGNGLQNAPTVWELRIIPIPEPGTLALLGASLLALSALSRRR